MNGPGKPGVHKLEYANIVSVITKENELCRVHPCVENLDSVRQLILMDMAFNMGVPRLCKFLKMWNAIHEGRFDIAASEMMDLRLARQVGRRAVKPSDSMKEGEC